MEISILAISEYTNKFQIIIFSVSNRVLYFLRWVFVLNSKCQVRDHIVKDETERG